MSADASINHWLLLDSGAGNYAFNMALDEALLEAMPQLIRPVVRFYGWTEKAASFGYFQKHAEVERLTLLRPLVRRPTGGGLVPHDSDWTYSLAFPSGHEWYELSATESYERVHSWIQAALAKLGVSTTLADCRRKAEAGQCFAGHEKNDLLWCGQKIAGAAQRRTRSGLLIQGSLQPSDPLWNRSDWQQSMCEIDCAAAARWSRFEPDSALRQRAQQLAEQKYARESYNRKR